MRNDARERALGALVVERLVDVGHVQDRDLRADKENILQLMLLLPAYSRVFNA